MLSICDDTEYNDIIYRRTLLDTRGDTMATSRETSCTCYLIKGKIATYFNIFISLQENDIGCDLIH